MRARPFWLSGLAASAIALAAGLGIGAASAADFQPVQAPLWNWTGIYAGVAAGGAFGDSSFNIKDEECHYLNGLCAIDHHSSGVVAGGQVYGLWQMDQTPLVFGAEVQGLWANLEDDRDVIFGLVKTHSEIGPLVTAKGQIGFALDKAYIYGTGGWAGLDTDVNANIPIIGARWSDNQFVDGWVYGAGAKWVAVDGTATGTNSVIIGVEWNHFQANNDFASQLKFKEQYAGGAMESVCSKSCYEPPKVKVGGDFGFDMVTANVSVKF